MCRLQRAFANRVLVLVRQVTVDFGSRPSRPGTTTTTRTDQLNFRRSPRLSRPRSRFRSPVTRPYRVLTERPANSRTRGNVLYRLLADKDNLTLRLGSTACFFDADRECIGGFDRSRRVETGTDESVIGNRQDPGADGLR